MSITFDIDLSNSASPALASLRAGLLDTSALHDAMGFGVGAAMKEHLHDAGYVGRKNALGGKTTGFWRDAAESITSEATATEATVTISHTGVALRYYGGEVVPTPKVKALAVPAHKSAHGVYARHYPDKLAFIPATTQFGPFRKGGSQDTVGYLVRGVERTITRGKNKGKSRIVPIERPGGELIYVLRRRTYHEPDTNILPTDTALVATAVEAGEAHLESLTP